MGAEVCEDMDEVVGEDPVYAVGEEVHERRAVIPPLFVQPTPNLLFYTPSLEASWSAHPTTKDSAEKRRLQKANGPLFFFFRCRLFFLEVVFFFALRKIFCAKKIFGAQKKYSDIFFLRGVFFF